jgi:glutamyl-tRNA reductase
MNRICCISINHKNAPVDIRERLRIEPKDILSLLGADSEAYPLNTCNRIEVYWTAIPKETVIDALSRTSGIDKPNLSAMCEYFTDSQAVRHLFMVASALDSLVIGEPQILGQIKDAYREALAAGTTSTILNKALHRAFRAAKRIRTETSIGTYSVSVASEAVELASHIFGDIGSSRALVIGAGDMAGIAAKRLKDRGVKTLIIMNRTHSTACDLAHELSGIARPFNSLEEELGLSDIVISSTGSQQPIITRDMVMAAMKLRKNRPIIIIDIAVPRDVDPAAGKCYNCYLYDIDALKSIVDKHSAHREAEAAKALSIIDEEVIKYERWLSSLTAQGTIKDLFSLVDSYIEGQVRNLPLPQAEKDLVEQNMRSSFKRLLHRPVSFLKEHPGVKYIEYVRRIFKLDEDYSDRHKG